MNLPFNFKLIPLLFLQTLAAAASSSDGEAGPAESRMMDVDLVWTSYFNPGTRLGKDKWINKYSARSIMEV